jgi:hypothetical protein
VDVYYVVVVSKSNEVKREVAKGRKVSASSIIKSDQARNVIALNFPGSPLQAVDRILDRAGAYDRGIGERRLELTLSGCVSRVIKE